MIGGRVIGILGGMGPEATVDLQAKIVLNSGAEVDQDHYRIIVDSNPKIPSRQAAILEGGEDPTAAMCETAQNLERAGADFIVIPCNAAHMFLRRVRESVSIPVLSMVDETVRALRGQFPELERVGLLASTAVVDTALYTDPLEDSGVRVMVPGARAQRSLMEAISHIKAGDKSAKVKALVQSAAEELTSKGAEAIILACTELPLVIGPGDIDVPVLDTTGVLALAAIKEARRD